MASKKIQKGKNMEVLLKGYLLRISLTVSVKCHLWPSMLPLLLKKHLNNQFQVCLIFHWQKEVLIHRHYLPNHHSLRCLKSGYPICLFLQLPNDIYIVFKEIFYMKLVLVLVLIVMVQSLPSNFDLRVQVERVRYANYELEIEGICSGYAWAKELSQIVGNAVGLY